MAILVRTGTDAQDAVFLHVPKTGGMWVAAVLDELGLIRCRFASKHSDMERVLHCARHAPLRYVEAVAKAGLGWQQRVREGFKFCFVRHPLTWYESYWLYMCANGWPRWSVNRRGRQRWHPNAPLDGLGDDDFNVFVRNVLAREPGYVGRMYSWYATSEIAFVGRQERLADDLIDMLARVGIEGGVERVRMRGPVNASDLEVARPQWDEGLRREVEHTERQAIERFGYAAGASAGTAGE